MAKGPRFKERVYHATESTCTFNKNEWLGRCLPRCQQSRLGNLGPEESERRTKFFAFCFLNIQSFAYDLPPVLLSDEMRLKLPCSCPEWTAPDATTWALLRHNTPNEQDRFDAALGNFLSLGLRDHHDRSSLLSPTANYVLLHGLLQKIVWSNRMLPINVSSDSSGNYKTIFE